MKQLYAIAILLASAITVQAQDDSESKPTDPTTLSSPAADSSSVGATLGFSPEIDKRYGFRGLRLETPLQQVKGLKLVANRGGKAIYQKITENKTLGNAHLKSVLYCFYKGQLSSIVITATGPTNAEEVVKVFVEAYGMPFVPEGEDDSGDGQFFWHGNKAEILLSTPADDIDFSVFIQSIPMREKQKRDEAQRVKQAADKL